MMRKIDVLDEILRNYTVSDNTKELTEDVKSYHKKLFL